jgi:hypothetical protein
MVCYLAKMQRNGNENNGLDLLWQSDTIAFFREENEISI